MTRGTIHPVSQDLFLVEGESTPGSRAPGAAVLRSGQRLYLLGSGRGPQQRAAIRAICASLGPCTTATLISDGTPAGSEGRNDDLLGEVLADRRQQLAPRPPTGRERTAGLGEPAHLLVGGHAWTGWSVHDDVLVLETAPDRWAFYVPAERALLLPSGWAAGIPRRDGPGPAADLRALVLAMIGTGTVEVLGLGTGAALDAGSARQVLSGAGRPAPPPAGRARRPARRA